MTQYETERKLCWLYGGLTTFLVISVICVAVPFNHWRPTLDVCPGGFLENVNCGCIFYGVSTFQHFNGGHNSTCHYAVYAPLPMIAYALVMFLYHMFRVCINNIGKYEDEKTTSVEEIEGHIIMSRTRTRLSRRTDSIIHCWVPNAFFASIFALYNLVHASIITDGYIKTCTQYRGHLVRQLTAGGNHLQVIHFRLNCQAIFDYMDYIQPQVVLETRRDDYINTGLSLQLALATTWISVFMWVVVAVYASVRAYKEREVLTCCEKGDEGERKQDKG